MGAPLCGSDTRTCGRYHARIRLGRTPVIASDAPSAYARLQKAPRIGRGPCPVVGHPLASPWSGTNESRVPVVATMVPSDSTSETSAMGMESLDQLGRSDSPGPRTRRRAARQGRTCRRLVLKALLLLRLGDPDRAPLENVGQYVQVASREAALPHDGDQHGGVDDEGAKKTLGTARMMRPPLRESVERGPLTSLPPNVSPPAPTTFTMCLSPSSAHQRRPFDTIPLTSQGW